jgi:glycosyltransferase involved in cell wall biosynthesis
LLNQIEIVLAEYGPSGVEMMSICNQLNIPLVVHFHGYDAYRNDVLSTYGTYYKELFQKASAIIGVSKDMCSQLIKLGCPKPKINYLTCGIDTSIFQFLHETALENKFVFCGRFVAKKAPELVIQAF